jgi:hypothetical protein
MHTKLRLATRPCWRCRYRWEDNITINFGEMECEVVDLTELAENRSLMLMNVLIP